MTSRPDLEKLDYVPGEFTVERHIRGKWACEQCETLIRAPVPAQVIDKGISVRLIAQELLVSHTETACSACSA